MIELLNSLPILSFRVFWHTDVSGCLGFPWVYHDLHYVVMSFFSDVHLEIRLWFSTSAATESLWLWRYFQRWHHTANLPFYHFCVLLLFSSKNKHYQDRTLYPPWLFLLMKFNFPTIFGMADWDAKIIPRCFALTVYVRTWAWRWQVWRRNLTVWLRSLKGKYSCPDCNFSWLMTLSGFRRESLVEILHSVL